MPNPLPTDGNFEHIRTVTQLGEFLRTLRGRRTQQYIADHAKRRHLYLHRPDVSTIERGWRLPTENELRGFLHACDRSDLFESLNATRLRLQQEPPNQPLRLDDAERAERVVPGAAGSAVTAEGDRPDHPEDNPLRRAREMVATATDRRGPRMVLTRPGIALSVGVVTVFIAVGAVAFSALLSDQSTPSAAPTTPPLEMLTPDCSTCFEGGKTFTQQALTDKAKNTFQDPYALTGLGPPVQPGQQIEVVCRFHDAKAVPSIQPGWWYLIASPPWNRQYYTPANSYFNGDSPEGFHITKVDSGVPVC